MYHLVEFTGPFGFVKPWTAVRDGKTCSLLFLNFSTIEGMRLKLGVSAILRYRLSWGGVDWQQEVTQSRDYKAARGGVMSRPKSVLLRGVLLAPRLVLALPTAEDAELARHQHLCLSRNEDLVLPVARPPLVVTPEEFELLPGAELLPAKETDPGAVLVGHNRYADYVPMYGRPTFTHPTPEHVY